MRDTCEYGCYVVGITAAVVSLPFWFPEVALATGVCALFASVGCGQVIAGKVSYMDICNEVGGWFSRK